MPRTPARWIAAAIAAVASLVVTRHGMLLDPDSPTYLWSARAIRADPSLLLSPPTGSRLSFGGLFPPLYPALLAFVGADDPGLLAVRITTALLAAAAAWLVVDLGERLATARVAVALAVVLLVSRGTLLLGFGFLMSDGLALVLLLALVATAAPLVRPDAGVGPVLRTAAPAAIASAGLLTRFAGLGMVLGLVVVIAAVAVGPLRTRVRHAALAGLVGVAPTVAWQLLQPAVGGGEGRPVGWKGIGLAAWEVPEALPPLVLPGPVLDRLGTVAVRGLGTLALALLVVGTVAVVRRGARAAASEPARTAAALLLVGWSHLAVLVAARLWLDRTIPVSGRLLLPWWTCAVLGLGIGAWDRHVTEPTATRAQTASVRTGALAAAVVLVVLALSGLASALRDPHGAWYDVDEARPSSLAAAAEQLPPSVRLRSNREDLLYLETGRATGDLPWQVDPRSGRANRRFAAQLDAVADEVRRGEAAIVLYEGDPLWAAELDEVVERTGLVIAHRDDEGAILLAA